MADGNEQTNQEPTADTVDYKSQFEQASKQLTEISERMNAIEADAKKAFAVRDEAKTKVKDFEAKVSEHEATINALTAEKQSLAEAIAAEKAKREQIETEARTELLSQLPDGDLQEVGKKLNLMDLRKLVKAQPKSNKSTNVTTTPGNGKAKTFHEWASQFS